MNKPRRMTEDEITRLTINAMHKVDLLGHRGSTLVTCDEVVAMTCHIAMSGTLPPLKDRLGEGAKLKLSEETSS